MLEILLLKGLPACGKSTYAKKLVEQGSHVRVNKDDLRSMLHNSIYSESNEKFVLSVRDFAVEECLKKNLSVVVDDTNFDGQHFKRMCIIAEKFYKDIVVREKYFPIDLTVAHERNEQRVVGKVPRSVIDRMYKKYVEGKTVKERFVQIVNKKEDLTQDKNLPSAIICDLDGTISLFTEEMRSPYDASKCEHDLLNEPVADVINTYFNKGYKILFVSGREDKYREQTEKFLKKHFPDLTYSLYMRKTGDMRKDTIIKKEIYVDNIWLSYYVRFVLDDRDQVVFGWRSIGLTCFQVADGDF
jgi:predicted kinase